MKSRQTPVCVWFFFTEKFVALEPSINLLQFFSSFFFLFSSYLILIVPILILYITSTHSSLIHSYIYIYVYKKINTIIFAKQLSLIEIETDRLDAC